MKNKTIPKDWEIYDENNPEHDNPSLYEVTEWSDELWSDGRRPESVSIGNINTCAYRRDFTINALYFNPFTQELLDPTGKGIQDIKNKIIRFIGRPSERINEDFLRIFRAYRQASQLGFELESKTLKACRTHFEIACKTVSAQRILVEVEKMCL